jgi:hypothetical protein
MVIITPTGMVRVIGFHANPCKWVLIGYKMGKNLATKKRLIKINSST